MKIEKISDTQIKFVLNKTDLVEKDIKITELAYGSEKTQDLFREMMEQAYNQCGFEAENAPLMIEAIPVTIDSIMIIVTKVLSNEDIESKFNLIPRAKDSGKFKKAGLHSNEHKTEKTCIFIYSFKNLDDVINLSLRLAGIYVGESKVYKYNGEHFLILENNVSPDGWLNIEAILGEYGQKHISSVISKYHLIEHGQKIIAESAIQILASI